MLGGVKRTTALGNELDGPRSLPALAGDLPRLTGRSRCIAEVQAGDFGGSDCLTGIGEGPG